MAHDFGRVGKERNRWSFIPIRFRFQRQTWLFFLARTHGFGGALGRSMLNPWLGFFQDHRPSINNFVVGYALRKNSRVAIAALYTTKCWHSLVFAFARPYSCRNPRTQTILNRIFVIAKTRRKLCLTGLPPLGRFFSAKPTFLACIFGRLQPLHTKKRQDRV